MTSGDAEFDSHTMCPDQSVNYFCQEIMTNNNFHRNMFLVCGSCGKQMRSWEKLEEILGPARSLDVSSAGFQKANATAP